MWKPYSCYKRNFLILNLTKGLKYKSLSLLIADFMFKKILIAEDLDSISITVEQALKELSITEIHHAKYCDDAFIENKRPFMTRIRMTY
jgi:hypothetical protein